jgi:hypothetical protein
MVNDLAGKLIADKYRVESLIREDDAGDLYSARHEVLDRPVTLKILPAAVAVDQRWVKRFVAEARAASALSHPNVLNLTDFGTDAKGVTYAVFESTEGTTLRDAIADGRPIDEKRALDVVRQIAGAVSAAHEKNITHGRLTPNNIFLENESVKVYGFGTDALESARGADPRYLAPEQSHPYHTSDARSDVYTLGVIFYELLSGAVPFPGVTAADVAARQSSEPPAPLSSFRDDLHPEIEPILLSAMALDMDRRYPTVAAFAEDLDLLASRIGGAPQAAAAAAGADGAPKRSNTWQTAIFVFAGVAIFAVALIYATSVRQTDPTETTVAAADGSLPVQPIGPATGAQEESLAKLPALTEAEIMAAAAQAQQMDALAAGGDGYNAWANGGIPPAGAPLSSGPLAGSQPGSPLGGMYPPPTGYVPQGGQVISVDGQSQFMPNDLNPGSVQLIRRDVQTGACTDMASGQPVPCPPGTATAAAPKASPTPKTPATAANTATTQPGTQPTPEAGSTPKPMATPPPKAAKPTPDKNDKSKPAGDKPAKSGDDLKQE